MPSVKDLEAAESGEAPAPRQQRARRAAGTPAPQPQTPEQKAADLDNAETQAAILNPAFLVIAIAPQTLRLSEKDELTVAHIALPTEFSLADIQHRQIFRHLQSLMYLCGQEAAVRSSPRAAASQMLFRSVLFEPAIHDKVTEIVTLVGFYANADGSGLEYKGKPIVARPTFAVVDELDDESYLAAATLLSDLYSNEVARRQKNLTTGTAPA